MTTTPVGSSHATRVTVDRPEIPSTDDLRRQSHLQLSVDRLRAAAPDLSAHQVLTATQRWTVLAVLAVLGLGLVADAMLTLRLLAAVASIGYAAALVYRLLLVRRGMIGDHLLHVTDEEALAVPDDALPVYTVLVPAYREPEVIARVVQSLTQLDYPADRLDIRLLLEQDDEETIAAARQVAHHPGVSVVLVPPGEPRTKPKACNFGLLSAPGALVTIYDAEDRPEPLQLRRAVVALERLGPEFACVQARLGYYNAQQNILTRWFTIEYANWFRFLLPGLVSVGAPVPLGGTSNHFRSAILADAGAWDPFNVTEDADLGIRLARLGYQVGVLDSVTLEEANSDFVNWIKQRSRWYKGYLQTWLVHMRHPVAIHRELGWRGSVGLHLFVAGTPVSALVNPVFWALTVIYLVQRPAWIQALFPPAVFYLAFLSFVVGNAAVVYMNVLTTRATDYPRLLVAALTVPAYWVMMSAAAVKAVVQLVRRPSYWEKTTHGLLKESPDLVIDLRSGASAPSSAGGTR